MTYGVTIKLTPRSNSDIFMEAYLRATDEADSNPVTVGDICDAVQEAYPDAEVDVPAELRDRRVNWVRTVK